MDRNVIFRSRRNKLRPEEMMDFKTWFKEYRKSYDLRCGMTELHMERAWETIKKEMEKELKCSRISDEDLEKLFKEED